MNEPKRKTLRARLTGWLKGETTPGVDPDVVRDMAKLLEETGLSEIEVERGGVRVRVAKNGQGAAAAPAPAQASPAQQAAPVPGEEPKTEAVKERGTQVNSPMVGTVYLSPEPGAPAFVQPGAMVKEGDTICIIEAMKTMNPVAATVSGRIADIQVSDAQPVEFGQVLMLIE